ncbi:MAG TPA: sulfotransferase domain-containing protein [Terriglobales bacterium]|nr:sulfotransferase domain-containing protein [Terriglobales bacterium]
MITVVSGIPRSGTSLMMQMLSAGGMEILSDAQRSADANNPRGYYELEAVKSLAQNSQLIAQAEGKAVKVISSLLEHLPQRHEYRIIFMRRPLAQILASQERMLQRLGQAPAPASSQQVIKAFERHLQKIGSWLLTRPHIAVLYVEYESLLQNPLAEASRISQFLGCNLDLHSMARAVDATLHRERACQ